LLQKGYYFCIRTEKPEPDLAKKFSLFFFFVEATILLPGPIIRNYFWNPFAASDYSKD
jgi:hypothetical protein